MSVINKARAQRRLNFVKATFITMFGGHWDRNYREGWVPLAALYITGTVILTNGSRTVTGVGTSWTSTLNKQWLQANNEYYQIASVTNGTTLILTQPFQGVSGVTPGVTYQIYQADYRLFPDVMTVSDIVGFQDPSQMSETWKANLKNAFPFPQQSQIPRLWSQTGVVPLTSSYSTGTISGSLNSNILTGSGTSWLSNLEPGWDITIGSTVYRVYTVDSDTQVTLYQLLKVAVAALTTYTAVGHSCLNVRFSVPSQAAIINYGYYAKDWPFINDNDTDWVAELYPHILVSGMTYMDYLDKNDTVRAREARLAFMDLVKDAHVAEHMNYSGVRTIALNIPREARD